MSANRKPALCNSVKNIDLINLELLGPKLVHHSLFPEQANITFVEKVNKKLIKVLFWKEVDTHCLWIWNVF